MNPQHSQAIVFLLAVIAAVLLFGKTSVLNWFTLLMWIAIGIVILYVAWVVLVVILNILKELITEIIRDIPKLPSELKKSYRWWLKGATAPIWAYQDQKAKMEAKAKRNVFDYILLAWEVFLGICVFVFWLYSVFMIIMLPIAIIRESIK